MKGTVFVFAILATECYCYRTYCGSSSDCEENEFCLEDPRNTGCTNCVGYCEPCPWQESVSNGHEECEALHSVWSAPTLEVAYNNIDDCKEVCYGEYFE